MVVVYVNYRVCACHLDPCTKKATQKGVFQRQFLYNSIALRSMSIGRGVFAVDLLGNAGALAWIGACGVRLIATAGAFVSSEECTLFATGLQILATCSLGPEATLHNY